MNIRENYTRDQALFDAAGFASDWAVGAEAQYGAAVTEEEITDLYSVAFEYAMEDCTIHPTFG